MKNNKFFVVVVIAAMMLTWLVVFVANYTAYQHSKETRDSIPVDIEHSEITDRSVLK
ncbi:hypothetical protein [Mucilaginibacter sp.]|uniref:hypothetical protein n=1 Tax=Mucilaginibacter sp. TaxID=1882438 RepID=UPI0032639883